MRYHPRRAKNLADLPWRGAMSGRYARRTHKAVLSALDSQAAVVLPGPRQLGKTTLAKKVAALRPSAYLDPERHADQQIRTRTTSSTHPVRVWPDRQHAM